MTYGNPVVSESALAAHSRRREASIAKRSNFLFTGNFFSVGYVHLIVMVLLVERESDSSGLEGTDEPRELTRMVYGQR